jgi:predicted dehydrogenase
MTQAQGMTRRRFLNRAAAGAGFAACAPYILTSDALGNADKAPANSRIGVGFIGVDSMGGYHLGNFIHNRKVQVRAVCDVDQPIRKAAADRVKKTYGDTADCPDYNDFRDLLARKDIDAVVIATPDHWHALIAIEACKAGKDIYCEKPLTLTIEEGRKLVRAVRRYGRVFQTGSQQRSGGQTRPESNFRFACELVRSGRIGRVHTVRTGLGGGPTCGWEPETDPPAGLDWNMWLGPALWKPYTPRRCHYEFRWFYDYSGGKMTDWGAHHNDIAQWGLGMDDSGPVHIDGKATFPQDGLYDTATSFTVEYTYANGVKLIASSEGRGTRFEGTDGWVHVDRGFLQTHPAELMEERPGPNDVHLYESPGHYEDWFQCVEQRRRPICDVEIGHRSATVCHLGNISMRLGRPIRWDPQTEQVIGDDEAARWVGRPMRAPWHL